MKRLLSFSAISFLLLSTMALDSFAIIIGPVTKEDLILNSHDIIHGIVKEVRSEWNENHSTINTYAKIQVLDVFKGEPRNQAVIQIEGGTVNDTTLWVEDEAELKEGMEVIIHTGLYENGNLGIYDGELGLYAVDNDVVEKLNMTLDQFKNLVAELLR